MVSSRKHPVESTSGKQVGNAVNRLAEHVTRLGDPVGEKIAPLPTPAMLDLKAALTQLLARFARQRLSASGSRNRVHPATATAGSVLARSRQLFKAGFARRFHSGASGGVGYHQVSVSLRRAYLRVHSSVFCLALAAGVYVPRSRGRREVVDEGLVERIHPRRHAIIKEGAPCHRLSADLLAHDVF